MNLYRLFYINKRDSRLLRRDKLLDALNGRNRFMLDDLNEIRHFRGLPPIEGMRSLTVGEATRKAFINKDLYAKFRSLTRLRGVGTVIASYILSFQNPYKYAGINHRVWNTLIEDFAFDAEEKNPEDEFSPQEYEQYLRMMSSLAVEYGMKPADVEFVLDYLLEER